MRLRNFIIAGLVIFGIGLGLSFQNIFEKPLQTLTGSNSDGKPDNKLLSGNEEPAIATPSSNTSSSKCQEREVPLDGKKH